MHAAKTFHVQERWIFDVDTFPAGWGDSEEATYNSALVKGGDDGVVNWTDVNEALRGALRRVAHQAESMPALPAGSTCLVAVELRDEAPPPIGHPQNWIPSQPNLQLPNDTSLNQTSSLGGQNTIPIRSVQAGPLFFECWIEQCGQQTSHKPHT
ncbi:hypothetical protein IL306_007919 [Fusarium sp. DS 682]|nr:hypothetical protein IL306_007919 [Fusarium sp. DS 682]